MHEIWNRFLFLVNVVDIWGNYNDNMIKMGGQLNFNDNTIKIGGQLNFNDNTIKMGGQLNFNDNTIKMGGQLNFNDNTIKMGGKLNFNSFCNFLNLFFYFLMYSKKFSSDFFRYVTPCSVVDI